MQFLILATLTSTLIIITFRLLHNFRVSIVQAITVNYLVACVFGFFSESGSFDLYAILHARWFYLSILMGFSLIVGFNLFALSAQKAGVAVTAISSRMSVAIPVVLGFILFGDSAGAVKIAGIVTALVAFYFTSKKDKAIHVNRHYAFLPVILFVAVGANDSLMKFAEYFYIDQDFVRFLATSFAFALLFGILVFLYKNRKTRETVKMKHILAGLFLGLLNWFSTYYTLKGLDVFEVSVFMPLYNVGVVTLSTLTGYLIFREKLLRANWIGIGLALIAIILIARG